MASFSAVNLFHDLRQGARALARDRAFSLSALATLALGIGVAGTVFTVISAVLLRPLPFPRPERLVQVFETTQISPEGGPVPWTTLETFRRESTSFDALAGYGVSARFARTPAGSERVMVVQAERDFFRLLGVAPLMGRPFGPNDSLDAVVVGEGFWKKQLDADPGAIGHTLTLDAATYVVVGVMPESFQFPFGAGSLLAGVTPETRTDMWVPIAPPAGGPARGRLRVAGRLKDAVALATAQSELAAIAARQPAPSDTGPPRGVRLEPLSEAAVPPAIRRSLGLLFGAAALLLGVACANVTNLSLVRMLRRSRELAIRDALGASARQLARLLVTESLLVATIGGVIGLILARVSLPALMRMLEWRIPRAAEVSLDWLVILFFFSACAFAGAIVGLASAAILPRRTSSLLKDSSPRSTLGPGHGRLRDALVVLQVALAFLLTVGASLLILELIRLQSTDTGMVTRNVLTVHLGQPLATADVAQFYEIEDRVARLPGVRAAGLTQLIPLQNWNWTSNSTDFVVRGRPPLASAPFPIELRYVSPGYFQTLAIPIRKGRAFTARDTRDAQSVIAINETLARRYFGDDDPIGRETNRGVIIAVAGDVRQVHLDRSASPEIYYPMAQNWSQVAELGTSLLVSVNGPPGPAADAVRAAVAQVNPRLALFNVTTMDEILAASLADFRLYLALLASFAVFALALAAIGTYGVIAHLAQSRSREWAIRAALGAGRARIARLVLGPAVRLTVIGLALGLAGAVAGAPLLRGLPVTIRPLDGATLAAVAFFVGTLALAACTVPARRAWSADPVGVLRED